MKNKLTLVASAVLALSLVFSSSANAKDNNHERSNVSQHQHQTKQIKETKQNQQNKVIYVTQKNKSNNKHNAKKNIPIKAPVTIVKIDTKNRSLLTLLVSQNHLPQHDNHIHK